MTDELNFDFNEINLDLLISSSPPKKVKCTYDTCMHKQELPLEYPSVSHTRNKEKRLDLAKKINEADLLLTKIENLEKQKVHLEQQLADFQKTANEIQEMYVHEKAQHEEVLTELNNYKEKYCRLDSEMANNVFKYEQIQAQFDEEKKRPCSYDNLALKFVKVMSKFEDNLQKTDLAMVNEVKQYCLDKKLKMPLNPTPSFQDDCSSPKKRKVRCAKIKKQEQSTQCNLINCTLEHTEYKETNSQGIQCGVQMREQSTQHISTMTTRGTTTRVFIKQHNVGTCFPEPKKPPSVEAILQEISQWNVRRISPIKDLTTMELKTYRTVGTCTWLCNIRRKIDFLPKKITRSTSRQCCQNIKQEIQTPISSPIPKQASVKLTEQPIASQANLSSKSVENVNVLNTTIFEDLWQIFGKMVRGLLQHNNNDVVSCSNNIHNINQQQFHSWLRQLYENTRFNENNKRLNSFKNQVLNELESKLPLIREAKALNENAINENKALSPAHFLEFPQLDCDSLVKPEPRRTTQADIDLPLLPTSIDTQVMKLPPTPNRNDNVTSKIQNCSTKKIKQKRKIRKGRTSDTCKRHFKLLEEYSRNPELNAVDFLASLRAFHSIPQTSNDKCYASMDAMNVKHQRMNKRETFIELFGESDDEEYLSKISNQTVITQEDRITHCNQSTLNSNPESPQVVATNNRPLSQSPILMNSSIENLLNSNLNATRSPCYISPIADLILTEQEIDNSKINEVPTYNVKENIALANVINSKDSKVKRPKIVDLIKNVECNENDLKMSEEANQEKDRNVNCLLINTSSNCGSLFKSGNMKELKEFYLSQSQIDVSFHLNSDTLEACKNDESDKESEGSELVIDEEVIATFEDDETKVPQLIESLTNQADSNKILDSDSNKTLDSTKLSNLLSSSLYEEMMTDSVHEMMNVVINEAANKSTTVDSSATASVDIMNTRKRVSEDTVTLVNSNKRGKTENFNGADFSKIIGTYTNFTTSQANTELPSLNNWQKTRSSNTEYKDINNKCLINSTHSTYNASLEFVTEQSSHLNKQSHDTEIKNSASLVSYNIYETMKINNNEVEPENVNSSGKAIQNECTSHTHLLTPKLSNCTSNNFYETSSLTEVLNNTEVSCGEQNLFSNCVQTHTENNILFGTNDSIQSPLPLQSPSSPTSTSSTNNNLCFKEPTVIPLNYIISNVDFEKQKNKSKHSFVDKLIDNYDDNIYKTYNRVCYAKLQPNDEAVKERVIAQLHDFCYTDNFTNGNMMASQLVKRIQAITTNYDYIYKAVVVIARNAPPCNIPEKDLPSIIYERPPRHLTNVLQRLDYVLKFFYYLKPDFCLNLMSHIEHLLFNVKQREKFNLTQCLHLTQLYLLTCELQKNHFEKHPARRFIANCLYYYNFKSVLLIHEVLMWCPTVLPPREERSYNRSDVIINVIKYLLMNYKYDMENTQLRGKSLLSKLRYEYHFEPFQPSQTDIITNLMEKLKNNKLQDITYAFVLICKRMPPDKTITIVLDQHLIPLANQYYTFAIIDDSYDTRIAAVLNIIAAIVKPFPLQTNVNSYLNLFARYLNTIDRPIIQEYALRSILSLQRFGYFNCYKLLCQHTSTCAYSEYQNRTIEAILKSFIYRKPKSFWKKVQLQMKE